MTINHRGTWAFYRRVRASINYVSWGSLQLIIELKVNADGSCVWGNISSSWKTFSIPFVILLAQDGYGKGKKRIRNKKKKKEKSPAPFICSRSRAPERWYTSGEVPIVVFHTSSTLCKSIHLDAYNIKDEVTSITSSCIVSTLFARRSCFESILWKWRAS